MIASIIARSASSSLASSGTASARERVQFLPKLPFIPLGNSPHRHADLQMKTVASFSTLAIFIRRPSGVLALGGSVEFG
jgi:hypothetical protein